jgi:hypothetical protein
MIPAILVGIGAAIAAGAVVAGIIYLALLTYKKIKDWFRKKHSLTEEDKHNIETTIKTQMDNGHYAVVQGIFNEETDEFVDGQRFEAEELDSELSAKHNRNTVVLYNY